MICAPLCPSVRSGYTDLMEDDHVSSHDSTMEVAELTSSVAKCSLLESPKSRPRDSELPFYYHTSSHTRFQEGPLPDFDESTTRRKRKGRNVPRREQTSAFAPRRATMPAKGSVSTRVQFHNVPIELPPRALRAFSLA